MKINNHINMVVLDDYHNYFHDLANDKRLPDDINLVVYKKHFKNNDELINNLYDALDSIVKIKLLDLCCRWCVR